MQKKRKRSFWRAIVAAIPSILLLATFGKTVHTTEHVLNNGDTVIVLHGLARTDRSMSALVRELENTGFKVHNIRYPSTQLTIPELTDSYLAPVVKSAKKDGGKIHFVTHSMGAILVRHYLADNPSTAIGRVVMLAPPNKGSELIDSLDHFPKLRNALGPSGKELSTRANSLVNTLPPLTCEVGVIAGTRSLNPVFSRLIAGKDDGKVSVASTRLPEMQDHIVIHTDHTFILQNREVTHQAIHYLKSGYFKR